MATDMAVLTLNDFLLARIAEDEARSQWQHRLLCMRTACDADGCMWGEGEEALMAQERVCTCGYPARVLAESKAKRRIVEQRQMWEAWSESDPARRVALNMLGPITMYLAAIYSDHPDYRSEWSA